MIYRDEIDGLRAVAVIPVIFFHAGFGFFSGGYVGVDVFFVISGYLITDIIVSDMEDGNFSLLNFYERRARRILPALLFMLILCLFYAIFWQPPFAAKHLSQSIFATLIFSQNILLMLQSNNYFDLASEMKLLLHTWSLSVEEQYYVFIPLLLAYIFKIGRAYIFLALTLLASISITFFLYNHINHNIVAFYSPISRAWELLSGACVALFLKNIHFSKQTFFSKSVSFGGLLIIVLCMTFFPKIAQLNLFLVPISVFGTCLFILFSSPTHVSAKILSNSLVVYVGLISYSLYLWHQPILAVFRENLTPESATKTSNLIFAIILTTFAAGISHKFVENPFRQSRIIKTKTFVSLISVIYLALIGGSLIGHFSVGFESWKLAQVDEGVRDFYISHEAELAKNQTNVWENLPEIKPFDIVVIGDSMASDTASALYANGYSVKRILLDGECFLEIVLENFACGVPLSELKSGISGTMNVILASDFARENSSKGVIALYNNLRAENINVSVLGSFRFKHASNISYRLIKSNESPRLFGEYFSRHLDPRNIINTSISGGIQDSDFIDKIGMFCPNKNYCNLYNEFGHALFYDGIHLTAVGQKYFGGLLHEWITSKRSVNMAFENSINSP